MADIVLICPKCGAELAVSEHVAGDSLPCSSCGNEIPLSGRRKSGAALRLKKRAPPETCTAPGPRGPGANRATVAVAAADRQASSLTRERERLRSRARINIGWAVFLLLAAALSYLRFFGRLPGLAPEVLVRNGLIALGACYVLAILLALKDNMFDGLLCIVVPLYPFYYILAVSNAVIVRAVVAALLVAFGYDLGLFLQDAWESVFSIVNQWIQDSRG